MFARLLDRLEAVSTPLAPLSWADVEAVARRLPAKTNLVVPKANLRDPPPWSRSRLGRSRGALRQFRCTRTRHNLHVKEFDRCWVVHVDRWNPHRHPVRHLFVDFGYKRFLHLAQVLGDALRVPEAAPAPTPAPVDA